MHDPKEILFDRFNIPRTIRIKKPEQMIIDKFLAEFKDNIKSQELISGIAFCNRPIVCAAYTCKELIDVLDKINRSMSVESAINLYYSMYSLTGDDIIRLSAAYGLSEEDKRIRQAIFKYSVLIISRPEFALSATRLHRSFFIEIMKQRIETGSSTLIFSGETKNKLINMAQEQSESMIKILRDENMRTIA